MARIKSRTIDRNRYCKKYPFIKAPKRLTFVGDKDMVIEVLSVTFSNESSKTVSFEIPFADDQYRVALSPRDNTATDSANVSLSVEDSVSDKSQIKILASAPFTGVVDVIAIRISS
tara:strand:- start:117 stop:464 length:348 start_codon:yes stop_codon:yes gene_type:complete